MTYNVFGGTLNLAQSVSIHRSTRVQNARNYCRGKLWAYNQILYDARSNGAMCNTLW